MTRYMPIRMPIRMGIRPVAMTHTVAIRSISLDADRTLAQAPCHAHQDVFRHVTLLAGLTRSPSPLKMGSIQSENSRIGGSLNEAIQQRLEPVRTGSRPRTVAQLSVPVPVMKRLPRYGHENIRKSTTTSQLTCRGGRIEGSTVGSHQWIYNPEAGLEGSPLEGLSPGLTCAKRTAVPQSAQSPKTFQISLL